MRTTEEQTHLYNEYKQGRGNLAAEPGLSDHEDGGPTGPRALDIYDSGKDLGVTRPGTIRSLWLKKNAPRFGFQPTGFTFHPVEAWHYKFTGEIGVHKTAPAAVGDHNMYVTDFMTEEHRALVEKFDNPFGLEDIRGIQYIAKKYAKSGADETELDNEWGSKSASGFANFLRVKYGYVGNDIFGPLQAKAAVRWLRARWSYQGNDVIGPIVRGVFQHANDENFKVSHG